VAVAAGGTELHKAEIDADGVTFSGYRRHDDTGRLSTDHLEWELIEHAAGVKAGAA
jgi:hypothetical protein